MRLGLPHVPVDPERRAIALQELLIDLGELIDADAPWQASLLEDGLTLERNDAGRLRAFGLFGDDEGWRLEIWSEPEDALWTERVRRAAAEHTEIQVPLRGLLKR